MKVVQQSFDFLININISSPWMNLLSKLGSFGTYVEQGRQLATMATSSHDYKIDEISTFPRVASECKW